jgi:site-specific DNA-methyltransferase (adenine-specific)
MHCKDKSKRINRSTLHENWCTPLHIINKYVQDMNYWDPCPFPRAKWDALEVEWKSHNFVNPPFGRLAEFTLKCKQEHLKGKRIVLLMPARVDTRYFHNNVLPYARIEFIKGRLSFRNHGKATHKQSAPFPCLLCHYGELKHTPETPEVKGQRKASASGK